MSAALEISQVSKSYGEGAATVHALQGVDLDGAARVSWSRSWARAGRARARC